jgi:shikimate kinase
MTTKIILTGFMATGKSVVGHMVAKQLGWHFADTDQQIVASAGKPIATIFAEHGEPHFRALERETIAMIVEHPRLCPQSGNPLPEVISTGGGALVDRENCSMLKRIGIVMCLTARPEIVAARVGRSATRRPKLLEGNLPLEQRIRDLMAERAAAYARADVTIDTSDFSPAQVAEQIIDAFVARERLRCKPSA